jgi:peroxiredoxin
MITMERLQQNVKVPVFNIQDIYDRQINLENYSGKRLLIAFFRHAGCPFCNLRVHALSKAYEELKKLNFEMIFFFESKKHLILKSTFHTGVSPIPIISDPEKKWYGTYGLETSAYKSTVSHITSFVQTVIKAKAKGLPVHLMASGESINTIPAEFLIDTNLVVKKLHYSQTLTDRLDIEVIRQFALTGEVPD